MGVFIDSSSRLHHDEDNNVAVTCPHCEVLSHITASAVPRFEDLQAHKPRQIGVVYRCDSCGSPPFVRYMVRMYGASRVELASNSPRSNVRAINSHSLICRRRSRAFSKRPRRAFRPAHSTPSLPCAGEPRNPRSSTLAKAASCACSMSSTRRVTSPDLRRKSTAN